LGAIPPKYLGTEPMSDNPFALLPTASNHAASLDGLYVFLTIVCGVSFVLVVGAMFYFMWKYKKKGDDDRTHPIKHNGRLEFIWSAVPAVFLLVFFVWGEIDFVKLSTPPADAMDIHVTAKQWNWEFRYPGNAGVSVENRKDESGNAILNEATGTPIVVPLLVVQKDKPVRLTMEATDVLHSFYVPAFRVKKDVVPGRYSHVWFTPLLDEGVQVKDYPIFCAEYCGNEHSGMLAKVRIVATKEMFDAEVAKATKLEKGSTESWIDFGKRVYSTRGCDACHSLDGTVKVGPSFKGLWGKTETLSDGSSVTVDENYFKQSLMEPNSQIVQGFPAQMPSFAGLVDAEQERALIDYLKSLK
jgi:cytochrome c oxidase subunit 2